MRIVFMGTPDFSVPSLKMLLAYPGAEVVGVFTQPDRPKGRGNKLVPSPVKQTALEAGIPVFQPEKIRKDGVEDLRGLKPDLCVTAAFGQILSAEILSIPPLGNINVHASLLPRHRGSSPIAHAILCGDRKTGVTTMMMDEGIDTGDILLCGETEIGESETCGELTERLSVLGAEVLRKTLKEMGLITFTGSAEEAKGLINGLNPWPCASIPCGEGRLKLLRAVCSEEKGRPGAVLKANPKEGLVIACADRSVRILEIQAPGGKRMKAEDYLRGHALVTEE